MFTEADIRKLQCKYFGERYRGASLAKIELPNASAMELNAWKQEPHNALVVLGPAGTGKTYLCSAMLEEIPVLYRSFRIHNERELLERLRQGIQSGQGDYLANLHYLIDDDFLILDDIGSAGKAKNNEWREEILTETIDFRYKQKLPTIYTSNLTKKEFQAIYHPRVCSRLFATENCIVDFFGLPDLREQGL